MNDPLGLFGDEATTDKDPLGLFGDNQGVLAAAGEAALNLGTNFLLTPVAGLRGLGKLMTGDSLEGAVKGIEQVQEEAYQPRGQRGQTYAENAAKVLNYIPEKIADFGEYVGGNEGRLVGEIGGEFALDLLPFGLLTKATKGKVKPKSDTLSKIREQIAAEAAVETQKPTTGYKPNDGLDGQMNLFEPEVEGRGVSPYEAYPGDWRVDENGIPVRVDLSLEAQNLQNPLQQNLWGDELNPGDFGRDPAATLPMDQDIPGYPRMSQPIRFRNDPENQVGITAAMDQMDPAARTAAIEQTQLGREQQASGELESARVQAEQLAWLESTRRQPTIGKKARSKKQSGGVWFGDLGESKPSKMQDALKTLDYEFQSLKLLPNKETITRQQVEQAINRQEVTDAERNFIRATLDNIPEESFSAKDFAERLNTKANSEIALNRQPTKRYANYGIESLNREAEGGPIDPDNWPLADLQEYMRIQEEVSQAQGRGDQDSINRALERLARLDEKNSTKGVKSTTNVWTGPWDLSRDNHFGVPEYFGHTRNFMEDGKRHVIEIQSDLVQKARTKREENWIDVSDEKLEGLVNDLYDEIQKLAKIESGEMDTSSLLHPKAFEQLQKEINRFQNPHLTDGYKKQAAAKAVANRYMESLTELRKELDARYEFDAYQVQVKPLAKNWYVRLIRQELQDAAIKGERTVRFASPDTVAKVESWPDYHTDAQKRLALAKKAVEEERAWLNAAERTPSEQQSSLNYTKDLLNEIASLEEGLQRPRFMPEHQGIYSRYQKEVVKYLNSIGGKPVIDDKGHTWIEVPVEPSRKRVIPFGQRGALKIDWDDVNKAENALIRSPDGTYIPTNPNVQEAITKALEGKDINVFTYTQSGATSTAMKTKNPVVKAASEIVQNAIKRADLANRNNVFPAENAVKRLNSQELIDLTEIFKDEMFRGERYPAKVLADNLSVKQLEAYTAMRDLFDKTLDAQNAARVLKGQEPISAKEAYLSSRWEGDFRQPVYELVFDDKGKPVLDKETKQQKQKLVWYLAAKSKVGLSSQIAALKKQYPDLVIDPKKGRVVKGGADRNQLQSMYSTVLDILGRDDPAVQRIREFVEQQTEIEGEGSLAQTKHFERKANIRGFVGDRPGKGGTRAEAIAMMQQQIQYAKNAFKWSELQTAAKDIKEIVSNPELQEKQPNTVNYVREYFKGALGFGESKLATAMDNLVRDMGISPAMAKDAVGNMKTLFILQKLALSTGYTMANLVQSTNMLPYLMDLRSEGFKGNPIKAALMGYLAALPMSLSHYMGKAGIDYQQALFDPFMKDAFKYAEDNGVIARSVYDESPIESSFSVPGTVARYAGKTMTIPETLVRSASFMAYAQMLKDSGKFTDASKLFQKAEELTNKSMVDYRETERPLMFGKAGTAGNFLNTLQTFPISFYNQFAYLAKQAGEGKVAGLVTFLALQYVMAGAMGLPYAQDLEKLFEWMRDNVAGDEAYVKMMENEFFSNPRLWLMEHLGESSVYGLLSTETGIGMTSRVSAPNPSDMLQSPAGPISDIYKQGSAALSAAVDPTNTTKLAQAAMLSTPVGLQGLLETAPFMEGITYNTNERGEKVFTKTSDLQDRKGVITRTPEEVAVRQWGLRPQREVSERALAYDEQAASQVERTRATNIVNKYYDAVRRGDMKKANNLQNIYIRLTGKEISNPQMENQVTQEFTDSVTKNTMKANTPAELLRHARVRQYLKEQK